MGWKSRYALCGVQTSALEGRKLDEAYYFVFVDCDAMRYFLQIYRGLSWFSEMRTYASFFGDCYLTESVVKVVHIERHNMTGEKNRLVLC